MKSKSPIGLSGLFILSCLFISFHSFAQVYVKSDFPVSDVSEYFHESPQLSVSDAGEMVVMWELTGAGDIYLKIISDLGEQIGALKEVETPYTTSGTRVAHNDDGNFMLIFGAHESSWYILRQTFTSEGVELTDTVAVERNNAEMVNIYKSSLQSNKDGQFGLSHPGLDSVIVSMFAGNGEYQSDTMVLKPDAIQPYEMYGLMTYSGELIMVWLDGVGGNFHGQRYSADGIPVGGVFQVSYKDESNYVSNAAMCADTAGNFAVVWTNSLNNELSIYSQLFSKEGVAIGANTRLTDDNASFEGVERSIDMDLDGNFIVAWSDSRSSDTSFVYMQQIDETGAPVGGNFRATTSNNIVHPGISLPSQKDPCVRILRDTIYLAWANYNPDVHYRDLIYANIQEWKIPDVSGLEQKETPPGLISIFPNPSQGSFTLQLSQQVAGNMEISIFNSSGMLIKKQNIELNGTSAEITLPHMKEGLYYLKIKGESFHSATPLIIKR